MSHSSLIISPDFTGVPNLEKLTLSSCLNLRELHPTVGILKKLVLLNLECCKELSHLPSKFEMDSLMTLVLSNCLKLKTIPENMGNMKCLQSLNLDFTAIKELPSSIGGLIGLNSLTLVGCKNLVCLPNTICCLKSLESLDLSQSSNFENLPENLRNVEGLKNLNLRGTAIKELPSSIECLMHLTTLTLFPSNKLESLPNTTCGFKFHGALNLSTCPRFKNLPENPWIIEGLKELHLNGTAIEVMPSSIGHLTNLTTLTLRFCMNLVHLPSTICSLNLLECIDLGGCSNFDNLPENLGNVKGLKELHLNGTAIKELPSSIEHLMHLTSLTLFKCHKLVSLPNNTCGFKFHGVLNLSTCLGFKNLPENPWIIEGLKMLDLSKTAIEKMPSSIGCLTNLTTLTLRFCMNLVHLPSTICSLKFLDSVDLFRCLKFDNLPENIGNMEGLKLLNLCWTAIKEIPSSIGCLSSLKCLYLSGHNFVSLPESISQLSNLRSLYLEGCKRLQSLKNVPSTIESITANDCISLERLPKLQYYRFWLDCANLQLFFFNCFKLVDNSMLQGVNNMLQVCLSLFLSLFLSFSKF